jgi:hypothetical protein
MVSLTHPVGDKSRLAATLDACKTAEKASTAEVQVILRHAKPKSAQRDVDKPISRKITIPRCLHNELQHQLRNHEASRPQDPGLDGDHRAANDNARLHHPDAALGAHLDNTIRLVAQFGRRLHPVAPDGNCFFTAMEVMVQKQFGKSISHSDLRRQSASLLGDAIRVPVGERMRDVDQEDSTASLLNTVQTAIWQWQGCLSDPTEATQVVERLSQPGVFRHDADEILFVVTEYLLTLLVGHPVHIGVVEFNLDANQGMKSKLTLKRALGDDRQDRNALCAGEEAAGKSDPWLIIVELPRGFHYEATVAATKLQRQHACEVLERVETRGTTSSSSVTSSTAPSPPPQQQQQQQQPSQDIHDDDDDDHRHHHDDDDDDNIGDDGGKNPDRGNGTAVETDSGCGCNPPAVMYNFDTKNSTSTKEPVSDSFVCLVCGGLVSASVSASSGITRHWSTHHAVDQHCGANPVLLHVTELGWWPELLDTCLKSNTDDADPVCQRQQQACAARTAQMHRDNDDALTLSKYRKLLAEGAAVLQQRSSETDSMAGLQGVRATFVEAAKELSRVWRLKPKAVQHALDQIPDHTGSSSSKARFARPKDTWVPRQRPAARTSAPNRVGDEDADDDDNDADSSNGDARTLQSSTSKSKSTVSSSSFSSSLSSSSSSSLAPRRLRSRLADS